MLGTAELQPGVPPRGGPPWAADGGQGLLCILRPLGLLTAFSSTQGMVFEEKAPGKQGRPEDRGGALPPAWLREGQPARRTVTAGSCPHPGSRHLPTRDGGCALQEALQMLHRVTGPDV